MQSGSTADEAADSEAKSGCGPHHNRRGDRGIVASLTNMRREGLLMDNGLSRTELRGITSHRRADRKTRRVTTFFNQSYTSDQLVKEKLSSPR